MFEKFKNLFRKKQDEPIPNPVVQLQYFSGGSWQDIKNKKKVVDGEKAPTYRKVITSHDGRVEIIDVI